MLMSFVCTQQEGGGITVPPVYHLFSGFCCWLSITCTKPVCMSAWLREYLLESRVQKLHLLQTTEENIVWTYPQILHLQIWVTLKPPKILQRPVKTVSGPQPLEKWFPMLSGTYLKVPWRPWMAFTGFRKIFRGPRTTVQWLPVGYCKIQASGLEGPLAWSSRGCLKFLCTWFVHLVLITCYG